MTGHNLIKYIIIFDGPLSKIILGRLERAWQIS